MGPLTLSQPKQKTANQLDPALTQTAPFTHPAVAASPSATSPPTPLTVSPVANGRASKLSTRRPLHFLKLIIRRTWFRFTDLSRAQPFISFFPIKHRYSGSGSGRFLLYVERNRIRPRFNCFEERRESIYIQPRWLWCVELGVFVGVVSGGLVI